MAAACCRVAEGAMGWSAVLASIQSSSVPQPCSGTLAPQQLVLCVFPVKSLLLVAIPAPA